MKNIAVIAGGDSAEFEISLQTANHIYNTIDKDKFKSTGWIKEKIGKHQGEYFQIDKNDFSFSINGLKIIFDFAYIAIHGTLRENGASRLFAANANSSLYLRCSK